MGDDAKDLHGGHSASMDTEEANILGSLPVQRLFSRPSASSSPNSDLESTLVDWFSSNMEKGMMELWDEMVCTIPAEYFPPWSERDWTSSAFAEKEGHREGRW